MMKNLLVAISFLLVLNLTCSCTEKPVVPRDTFTVSGNIKGLNTDFMYTSYKDDNGDRVGDSVLVENESFRYTGKTSKPVFIIFWPQVESTIKRSKSGGYYPAKSSQFAFLAAPGDRIEFKGEITDFVNAYPTGTPANEDLAKINRQLFPLLNQSVNLTLKKEKLNEADPRFSILEDSIQSLEDRVLDLKKEFVKSNPDSKAAVWYLSDLMMRHQISETESITAFNALDQKLKDYPFYQEIETRIMGIKSTAIGEIVPEVQRKNILTEADFSLHQQKGKYVLIDFWGTWCGPCVAEMPQVKTYQEKYIDQLVVLGINSGDTEERVQAYTSDKGYGWPQVMAQESGAADYVLQFNVTGFPTKLIIDPEGKIIYRFLGGGEEPFEQLDRLLAEK